MNKKIALLISILLILVASIFICFNKNKINIPNENLSKLAYIIIDINPSVELVVDDNDIVKEVVTLNNDADVAFYDVDLVDKSLDEATKEIIDTAIELGYILNDDNVVNVTGYTEDDERKEKLEKKVAVSAKKHLQSKNINANILENGVTDDIKNKAESYEVSPGKMLLVSRALQLNAELKEEEIVNMSVKEIQAKIKEQAVMRREEFKEQIREEKKEFNDLKIEQKAKAKENSQKNNNMKQNNR